MGTRIGDLSYRGSAQTANTNLLKVSSFLAFRWVGNADGDLEAGPCFSTKGKGKHYHLHTARWGGHRRWVGAYKGMPWLPHRWRRRMKAQQRLPYRRYLTPTYVAALPLQALGAGTPPRQRNKNRRQTRRLRGRFCSGRT